MSGTPDPNNPDNTAIQQVRGHVANLEAQLSQVKIDKATTEQEKANLITQKELLESQLVTAKAELEEKEAIKTRATELETRFTKLVEKEIESFPEAQRESAKSLIEGLTPDKALDKLEALKAFVVPSVIPTAGNPPPGPINNNNNNRSNDPPAPDEDKLKDLKELVKKGGDPLATVLLKSS